VNLFLIAMDTGSNNGTNRVTTAGFFKSWQFWKPFIGIVAGASGGFLYYHFVGCKSGTCPITGNPWGSVLMGGLLGYLVSGMFDKKTDK